MLASNRHALFIHPWSRQRLLDMKSKEEIRVRNSTISLAMLQFILVYIMMIR